MQSPGCSTDVELFRYGDEISEMSKIHGVRLSVASNNQCCAGRFFRYEEFVKDPNKSIEQAVSEHRQAAFADFSINTYRVSGRQINSI